MKVKVKKVKKNPAPIMTEQDINDFPKFTYSDEKIKNSKIVVENLMKLRFLHI